MLKTTPTTDLNTTVKKLEAKLKKELGSPYLQLVATDFGSGRYGYTARLPCGIELKLVERPDGDWSLAAEPTSWLKKMVGEYFALHVRKKKYRNPRTGELT